MRQLKISKSIINEEDWSLTKYLQEIGREELIPMEEERILAQEIHKGNRLAFDKLVRANLRFVVSVAKQYQNKGLSLPDLIQEGNLGLMQAAEKFDEKRGFKFISYAVWWIRASILQALGEQSHIIRIPQNLIGTFIKVQKGSIRFEQENDRMPSFEELADELGIETEKILDSFIVSEDGVSIDAPFVEKVVNSQYNILINDDSPIFINGVKISGRDISVDPHFADGDANSLIDILVNKDALNPDEKLINESLRTDINRIFVAILSERESELTKRLFGIGYDEMTLDEIGDEFGLTPERVRQIKEKAIKKIKKNPNNKILKERNDDINLIQEEKEEHPAVSYYNETRARYSEDGRKLCEVNKDIEGEFVVKEGTKRICSYAFQGCNGITSIIVPSSVRYIDDSAFSQCKNLKSIVIPPDLWYIGAFAFAWCDKLECIELTSSEISIKDTTFIGCSDKLAISIPEGTLQSFKSRLPSFLHRLLKERECKEIEKEKPDKQKEDTGKPEIVETPEETSEEEIIEFNEPLDKLAYFTYNEKEFCVDVDDNMSLSELFGEPLALEGSVLFRFCDRILFIFIKSSTEKKINLLQSIEYAIPTDGDWFKQRFDERYGHFVNQVSLFIMVCDDNENARFYDEVSLKKVMANNIIVKSLKRYNTLHKCPTI